MPRRHFLSARLQKGSKEKLKGNSDFPSDRKALCHKNRFGNTSITETKTYYFINFYLPVLTPNGKGCRP